MLEQMTKDQFACWFAGFFDGEGCIHLNIKNSPNSIGLTVANTNKDVILAIHERLGIGTRSCTIFSRQEWKPKYIWRTRNRIDCETVLKQIIPYLTIKKEKALIAIATIHSAKQQKNRLIERNSLILDMLRKGITGNKIAKKFGISPSLVAGIHTGRVTIATKTSGGIMNNMTVSHEKYKKAPLAKKITTYSKIEKKSSQS